MLAWPAIDLMGGRAVRLVHGKRDTAEVVGDPLEIAARWARAGQAHVVDLDAAFAGAPSQGDLVRKIAEIVPVQVGGGVRSLDDIQGWLDAGARRVVVGTAAFSGLLAPALARFGADRIVVAADVKDGMIAVKGWTDTSDVSVTGAVALLREAGVQTVLVTAVHRDGTMEGPDCTVLDHFHQGGLQVLASGGIGTLEHLVQTRKYAGTIIGKALYAGRFSLAEAMSVLTEGARC